MSTRYSAVRVRSRLRTIQLEGVYRVIRSTYSESPLDAVPAHSRFSDPAGVYAVLYAADTLRCAFWEAVARGRLTHRATRTLPAAELRARVLVTLCSTQHLQLVDLRHDGLIRLGAPTAVTHDGNHSAGRALSAAIVSLVEEADGVVYQSRFTGDLCFALFDRALHKLDTRSIAPLIEHEALIAALNDYDIELTEAPQIL